MGEYKQVLTLIEKACQINPLNSFLINLKVDTLLKLKRIDEAETILKDMTKEINLEAVTRQVWKKLIKIYISQKRFDDALIQIKNALAKIGYERDLIISIKLKYLSR